MGWAVEGWREDPRWESHQGGGRDSVLENSVPMSQSEGPTAQPVSKTLPKAPTQSSEGTHCQGAWVLRVLGDSDSGRSGEQGRTSLIISQTGRLEPK